MGTPTVLLIEDDTSLAEVTAEVLAMEGFRVVPAHHGEHALALLETLTPDVILTDLMMPVMDGLEFLHRYRSSAGPHAPVLAVSAFEPYLISASELGAEAVLAKPITMPRLVATLRELVAGHRVEHQAPSPAPNRDLERLRLIMELEVDRPAPTDALDQFVRRVARVFHAPVCLVSIVTLDRQYWHAQCGLPGDLASAGGTPREVSFCTHAVAARAALVVQDAAEHPFFRSNELVRQRGLRFYAGVPLITRHGLALGTLCLLDFEPRGFGLFDLELLSVLARRVLAELESREQERSPGTPRSAFQHLSWIDRELGIFSREGLAQVVEALALRAIDRREPLALGAFALRSPAQLEDVRRALPDALFGRLGLETIGLVVPGASRGEAASLLRAAGLAEPGCEVIDVPVMVTQAEFLLRELETSLNPG